MKKEELLIKTLAAIIAIIFGFTLIRYSSSITEYITPTDYPFEFDIYPKLNDSLIFNSFFFTYDFTNKNGSIKFKLDSYERLTSLQFTIPSLTNLTENDYNVELLNHDARLETKLIIYKYGNIFLNTIIIENIPQFEDMLFLISYHSNIEPSGAFIINNIGRFRISGDKYEINMILGDDYLCQTPCVTFLENLEEYRLSSSKSIKLKFSEKASEIPIESFLFKIEAINKKKLEDRRFWNGIGISIFASGVILTLNLIITIITKSFRKEEEVV